MNHLTCSDYAKALQLLSRLEAQSEEVEGFAHAAVEALSDFIGSEFTALSVCDLLSGRRQVVSARGGWKEGDGIGSNGGFFEHPLTWYFGFHSRASQRVSVRAGACRREHVVIVPLYRDGRTLVGVVLNRQGRAFDERDRERLELLQPHLAFLYAHASHTAGAPAGAVPSVSGPPCAGTAPGCLTAREREVLRWLACGKTDAEIAALLSISTRTVNKHLEHVYVKLGVETRTAAVMRALSAKLVDGELVSIAVPGSGDGFDAPPWRAVHSSHPSPVATVDRLSVILDKPA